MNLGTEVSVTISAVSSAFNKHSWISQLEANVRVRSIGATKSKPRHSHMKPAKLSQKWDIGFEMEKNTLEVTTQKVLRSSVHPIYRRYRTRQQQFLYNRLHTKFYLDTMFASKRSILGNTCAQIFVNDVGFSKFILMKEKLTAGNSLDELFQDIGVPTSLNNDGAKEMTMGNWKTIR